MRIVHFAFCFIFSAVFCFSQNIGSVEYDFFPNYDKLDGFPSFPSQLIFEEMHSVYIIKSTEVKETYIDNVKDNGEVNKVIIEPGKTNSFLLKNNEDNTILDEESVFSKRFLVKDAPVFEWKLMSDTIQKKLLGFNCNKAEIDFRGRFYEVWYTPEIPISEGPWKFKGLPGLILEVKSKDGEISYVATAIKIPFDYDKDFYQSYYSRLTQKYKEMYSREEFKVERSKVIKNTYKSNNSRVPNMEGDDFIGLKVNSVEKDLYFNSKE